MMGGKWGMRKEKRVKFGLKKKASHNSAFDKSVLVNT